MRRQIRNALLELEQTLKKKKKKMALKTILAKETKKLFFCEADISRFIIF